MCAQYRYLGLFFIEKKKKNTPIEIIFTSFSYIIPQWSAERTHALMPFVWSLFCVFFFLPSAAQSTFGIERIHSENKNKYQIRQSMVLDWFSLWLGCFLSSSSLSSFCSFFYYYFVALCAANSFKTWLYVIIINFFFSNCLTGSIISIDEITRRVVLYRECGGMEAIWKCPKRCSIETERVDNERKRRKQKSRKFERKKKDTLIEEDRKSNGTKQQQKTQKEMKQ